MCCFLMRLRGTLAFLGRLMSGPCFVPGVGVGFVSSSSPWASVWRYLLMLESDRAFVRVCLEVVDLGMSDARGVLVFWESLSEAHRREWKEFGASVAAYHRGLKEESRGDVAVPG